MHTDIYIALGANLGDRVLNFKTSISLLKNNNICIKKVSKIYETTPMYAPNQPRFLNMALHATTAVSPERLLAILKHIERQLGRTTTYTNGPRVIDLDILYYGDIVLDTNHLHIPHLHIPHRPFVLHPMLDIAPDYMDMRTKKTIRHMATAVPADKNMTLFPHTFKIFS